MIPSSMLTCLVLLSSLIPAEPIPKESEARKTRRIWGDFVDSAGGAKHSLDGEKLKLKLPAGDRLVYPLRPGTPTHAPYFVHTVRGDFAATVTVHQHIAPANALDDQSQPLAASGLIAIFDEKTATSFARGMMKADGTFRFRSTFRYPNGSSTSSGSGPAKHVKAEKAMLRLSRIGDKLSYEYRFNADDAWTQFFSQSRATPEIVKVGVYAEHSVDSETEAVFEGFQLKDLRHEKLP